MTRETVIQGYLMNSPKVVAEMLYDTIEKYENKSCQNCKRVFDCKIADKIKTENGFKLKEMCFYCWEGKE